MIIAEPGESEPERPRIGFRGGYASRGGGGRGGPRHPGGAQTGAGTGGPPRGTERERSPGSVTLEDVARAASPAKAAEDRHGEVERVPLRGVRRTIARNLVKAHLATAFVTCMAEADVSDLWELRLRELAALKEKGIHLTFFPFFIKAVQHALVEHPLLNAAVDEEAGRRSSSRNTATSVSRSIPPTG